MTTAGVTTALVPFIQAMAAKAGEDGYDAVRERLRNLFSLSRKTPPPAMPDKPYKEDQLLIIQPPGQHWI